VTGEIDTLDRPITRTKGVAIEVDTDLVAGTAILAMAVVIGLATAGHYGITIDEFNTDDYGPKALAWYTSGFTDRSHFETVEFKPLNFPFGTTGLGSRCSQHLCNRLDLQTR